MLGDFFQAIGDFFQATFTIIPLIGSMLDILLILIGITLFTWWMVRLNQFGKEDKQMEKPRNRNIN